ncbi:hypothetical protein [Microbulbifer sp. JMSA003]|uniref:hypothetical protein n=1 Tax=Microbulbifer sp. JMSA003 TaxID=3243369 RepID=UPI004039AD1B
MEPTEAAWDFSTSNLPEKIVHFYLGPGGNTLVNSTEREIKEIAKAGLQEFSGAKPK